LKFALNILIFCLINILSFINLNAQEDNFDRKKYNEAVKLFDNEEFEEALKLFLPLDSVKKDNFELKYQIGVCYLNTKYEKYKGIPYLEYALEKGESLIPKDVFKELGILYHFNYEFEKSEVFFRRYLKLADKDDKDISTVVRMIDICSYAKTIKSDSLEVEIEKIKSEINTKFSECSPHISADESSLYFTRDYFSMQDNVIADTAHQIYISKNENNIWQQALSIHIESENKYKDLSIAGISPDGNTMFVLIKINKHNSDIFSCQINNTQCESLQKLNGNINSIFQEGNVSITPNGNTLYFSSSRPGGYGGKDIYKTQKTEKGDWGKPVNLGALINTKYDEDSPFIHPDGKTLYFSSKGHNTMGGYDIFKSIYIFENEWSNPINIGYPINTTKDDNNFVLSADGNYGYFSSSINNKDDSYDIYKVFINKSIPLTLVKGIITAGDPPKPVKAKIKVIDKETGSKINYVYNSNSKTGKYLMIFPPGKNYDMIIEADNFLPHLLNIYIPNQTYFYELFQEIHLSAISIDAIGKTIGEKIFVNNIFYDIYDLDINKGDSASFKDYSELLEIINEIIEKTDSVGFDNLKAYSEKDKEMLNDSNKIKKYDELLNLIDNAIENTDTTTLNILNETAVYEDKSSQSYFYNANSDSTNLKMLVVGQDTIWVLSPLNTVKTDEVAEDIETKGQRFCIVQFNILFELADTTVQNKYYKQIDDIVSLIINNPKFDVELHGFADTQGNSEYNLNLSENRAISVMKYLLNKNVSKSRILTKAFGESRSLNEKNEKDRTENRRVEILIYKTN